MLANPNPTARAARLVCLVVLTLGGAHVSAESVEPDSASELTARVAALESATHDAALELLSTIEAARATNAIDSGTERRLRARLERLAPRQIPWGWYAFGLAAQSVFFGRFLLQWVASERAKASVIPAGFWYLSLAGSLMLLTYATVFLRDPIIILGQSTGFVIYLRNLALIRSGRRRDAANAKA